MEVFNKIDLRIDRSGSIRSDPVQNTQKLHYEIEYNLTGFSIDQKAIEIQQKIQTPLARTGDMTDSRKNRKSRLTGLVSNRNSKIINYKLSKEQRILNDFFNSNFQLSGGFSPSLL